MTDDVVAKAAAILGSALLCILGGFAARTLQGNTDSRVFAWGKYLIGAAVASVVVAQELELPPFAVAIALAIAGAVGFRNAPTRRQRRIREHAARDVEAVRRYFEEKAAITIDEADRQDELHRKARSALRRRDVAAFRSAVDGITDLDRQRDAVDGGFRALLIEAAEAGTIELSEILLAKGSNVNHIDSYRGAHRALHIAAQNGHLAAARLLIESGADVNARDQWGKTALWSAACCHGGHPQIVDLLLRSGANPELADTSGRTPLDWAILDDAKNQNAEVVAILRSANRADSK